MIFTKDYKPITLIFFCIIIFNVTKAQVTPSHTVVLILENRSYNHIVGNAQAPYLNSLIGNAHTAVLTQSFGLAHPSQPNYIMLYSGSNQGVIDNNVPAGIPFTTSNLGAEVINKGLTFIGYSEDLPSVGSNVAVSGKYARKHNPWVNWQGTGTNSIPASSNRPFSDFPSNFNSLPTLSFVVPNLDNDMHDGSIPAGDTWIHDNLDAYIQWCVNNNSLFILTFDEDDYSQSNQVFTFFLGADVKGGSYNQPVTHYNILRTVEDLYQLPYAGASADSSAVNGIWLSEEPVSYTFTGTGNWNVVTNWTNGLIPPSATGAGSSIIINHSAGGQCTLNISYDVTMGTSLTVMPGKKLVVRGALKVTN